MNTEKILPRSFYERDTLAVAKDLLGKIFVKDNQKAYIVETEAYIGVEDKASHASLRKRETCFPLWGPGGFTYVYMTYGMYYMLSISTENANFPAAVLIRALEPVQNINGTTNGPGKLTRTLNINKTLNNIDVTKLGNIYLADKGSLQNFETVETTRIGVDYAGEYAKKPWRFYIKDNPYVSVKEKI